MLGVLGNDWNELDECIWLLGLGTQEPTSATVSNSTQNPSKSKYKKKHGSQSNKMNAKDVTSSSTSMENIDNRLDYVNVLDLSFLERQERVQRQVPPFLFMNTQDILDETAISTVVITLPSLRLFQTIVTIHNYAITVIQKASVTSWIDKEILINHLIQSYLGNLKYFATL